MLSTTVQKPAPFTRPSFDHDIPSTYADDTAVTWNATPSKVVPDDHDKTWQLLNATLGLVGEAGELFNRVWDEDETFDDQQAYFLDELGDVLYYLTRLSMYFGYPLLVLETDALQHETVERMTDHYGTNVSVALPALVSAATRVGETVKKYTFHGKWRTSGEFYGQLRRHLVASLAATIVLAKSHDLTLAQICNHNVAKLKARYPQGFVSGGGNR